MTNLSSTAKSTSAVDTANSLRHKSSSPIANVSGITSTESLAQIPTTAERLASAPGTADRLLGYSGEPDGTEQKLAANGPRGPVSADAAERQIRTSELQERVKSLDETIIALGTGGGYVTQTLQVELTQAKTELAQLQGSARTETTGNGGGTTSVSATDASTVEVDGVEYQLGANGAPDIRHDNGFLQNPDDPTDPAPIPTREPTQEERDFHSSQKRNAGLGNIVSGIPGAGYLDSRANLDEAIDAYRHFLDASGETYTVDYGKYLSDDPQGNTTRQSITDDVQSAGDQLFGSLVDSGEIVPDTIVPGESVTFTVSGDPIAVNENFETNPDARYPYPGTENWQKAIGAHHIWTSTEVTVTRQEDGTLVASAEITVNFEDRYNFNPGQNDIATNVPDSERGVLEESGLAQQFDQTGQTRLTTEWVIGAPGLPVDSGSGDGPR